MPGRIVGVSIDSHGQPGLPVVAADPRAAHPARKGDIERLHGAGAAGGDGVDVRGVPRARRAARPLRSGSTARPCGWRRGLEAAGFKVDPQAFFDTITVDVGPLQSAVMKSAVDEGINLRRVGETRVGITLDERRRPATVEAVWRAFGIEKADASSSRTTACPKTCCAKPTYLTHPIFHMNRAETEMMRYMRRLADRDLALDRAMIPLGSCTMKLNSAAEMMPVSWREFSLIHPYVPADQALGYKEMIDDLSAKLCDITGYDAISMQPNSGAQGEYAGLLTIAGYHRRKGKDTATSA